MQYDIFISYRRSSYDTANLIATRLKAAGYPVFFDMETLRSGKFNEQNYDTLKAALKAEGGDGSMRFLRLEGKELVEYHRDSYGDTSIVGFLNLTD